MAQTTIEQRLAAQYTTRAEHWAHFREMAETWEMLHRHQQEKLKREQEKSRLQTIALANHFRDALLLSDTGLKGPEAGNEAKVA